MLYCSAFKVFCFELYLLNTHQVEQKKEFESTRVEIINPKLDFSDKKNQGSDLIYNQDSDVQTQSATKSEENRNLLRV